MENLTTKVSFELSPQGKAEVHIVGNGATVRARLMTIIERMAELEDVKPTEFLEELLHTAHMKEEFPIEGLLGGLFEAMFGDSNDEEECDGDCENCQEMPQELKNLFDKIFGGSK